MAQAAPQHIQIIGDQLALCWPDGREDYLDHEYLRKESPSALNKGERDIFGNRYGGDDREAFPGVRVTGWHYTGNYGLRLSFSDGHNTGIYSWTLLRELGEANASES